MTPDFTSFAAGSLVTLGLYAAFISRPVVSAVRQVKMLIGKGEFAASCVKWDAEALDRAAGIDRASDAKTILANHVKSNLRGPDGRFQSPKKVAAAALREVR